MPVVLRSPRLRAAIALALMLGAPWVQAQAPARTPAAPPATRTASPVTPWETNATVRQSMQAIQSLLQAELGRIQQKQTTVQDYHQLALAIEPHLAAIAKGPKLAPPAQAAFDKRVLTDLRYCLDLMRNGTTVALQRTGALGLQQTLHNYPEYFLHPGWR